MIAGPPCGPTASKPPAASSVSSVDSQPARGPSSPYVENDAMTSRGWAASSSS